MNNLTKAERYAVFLMTYLPRLGSVAIYGLEEKVSFRGAVLMEAQAAAADDGLFLEFGVYRGDSIRLSAARFNHRHFYGFDSFEGFPDDGRRDWRNDFSVQGLPDVPSNVTLIKGWFNETIPPFLEHVKGKVSLLNVDCDIYSSTKDVFDLLLKDHRFSIGTIISFDEIINYKEYLQNEMFALFEFLELSGFGIEWIACHKKVRLIEETIHLVQTHNHPTWRDDLLSGYYQQAALRLTGEGLDYSLVDIPHVKKRIDAVARFIEESVTEAGVWSNN